VKIWILQTGEPLPSDGPGYRPMRASNLTTALVARGHNVVLWSTAFFHQERRHRTRNLEVITMSDRLQVRLIPSPGYSRNIGPGRLYDHALLAVRLKRLLGKERSRPDVAFIGYPPIEVAAVMSAWLKEHGIPSILDAKDQWPQIFVDPFPGWLQPLARLALFPYFYLGRRAMRDATGLISMADSFLGWARSFSGRSPHEFDAVFPLSSTTDPIPQADLEIAQLWCDQKGMPDDGRMRVCFVGSLSPAFDFAPVRMAAQEANAAGKNWQFVICGDGSRATDVRSLMADLPNVIMPGWIDRAQMVVLAQRSMAALGPYHNIDNFKKNIPNKVLDAMAMGLPLLTPLEGEVQALVERHATGIMYGKERTLFQALELLEADPALRETMSGTARRVHQEQYVAERVYGDLVSHLELLAGHAEPHYPHKSLDQAAQPR
jgi:glycosyltransferase involved in cell wall biosynthesis